MTKHNFYVLTGGPGAGKTSLLNFLHKMGFSFIPETAREIIKQRLAKGLSPRPDPPAFAKEMFKIDLDHFLSRTHSNSLLFFDRSFLDSACLLFEADPGAYQEIESICLTNRYNQKVFIAPPWEEIYQTDSERDQDFEESIVVHNKIRKWYSQHGYEIVIIPKNSVEQRARFILDHILA